MKTLHEKRELLKEIVYSLHNELMVTNLKEAKQILEDKLNSTIDFKVFIPYFTTCDEGRFTELIYQHNNEYRGMAITFLNK